MGAMRYEFISTPVVLCCGPGIYSQSLCLRSDLICRVMSAFSKQESEVVIMHYFVTIFWIESEGASLRYRVV